MPINILVTSQKFFNEYKNDVGFVSNLGDFANNLSGSVMENIKVVREVDISWNAIVTTGDAWSVDTVALKITRQSGNFFTDGFTIGDEVDWLQNGISTANITINSISQDGKIIIYTLNSGAITDSNNAQMNGLTPLEACIYKFGLEDNNLQALDVESQVSGNDQGYYGSGIGFDTGGGVRDTNFVTLNRLGQYEDWRTGSCKIRFVSNPTPDVQRFEIEHEFTIVPYYLDGELSNLQNNVIPQYLDGLNSLKYAFEPAFRTVLSNPNTEKKLTYYNDLGSVAWFNENFNGFNSDYQINSIDYEEQATGTPADGLLIGSKTRVTVEVEKISGVFSAGERAGVYVSQLPLQAEYQNTTLTDLKDNFIYDNAVNNASLVGVAGQDFITDFTISAPVGNTMTFFFDVEYSSTQKAFLSNKNSNSPVYFLIGVQLGDVTLSSGNSDRLIILSDVEVYDESPDIPNLMDVTKFDIYPHDQQIGVGTGSTNMTSWNEDGLVVDFEFSLNLLQQANINSLEFKLLAYDSTTEQFFDLDSYNYQIFPATVSGGVQQLNTTTTRNYILNTGDQFNDVTITTGSLIGDDQFYSGRFAQKISWQEWLSNLDVDTIFYDVSEPNDNLNFKTSNYSALNNYEIKLGIFANIDGVSTLGVSGNTDYLFLSPDLTVYNYEEDGGADVWSCTIETFDNINMTNLSGAILNGQDTLFKTTWVNSGGPVASLTGLWGINRIEITEQAGYEITEMSSLNLPLPTGQQLLKPSVGTLLDVTLVGGNVVMECLIDGNLITSGTNYNLSSRIHDTNTASVDGKITEQSVDKDTEAGVQKIIE